MIGERESVLSGRTVVVKSHLSVQKGSKTLFENSEKCIFLLRNPKNAILAEIKRTHAENHIADADASSSNQNSHTKEVNFDAIFPNTTEGHENLRKKIIGQSKQFLKTYTDRKEFCQKGVLYVKFENFKLSRLSMQAEMVEILDFLGLNHVRLNCLKDDIIEGDFHRSGSSSESGTTKNEKNSEIFEKINSVLSENEKFILDRMIGEFNETVFEGELPGFYAFY